MADTPSGWQAIAVRHLLTRSAGIVDEPLDFDPSTHPSDADLVKSAYSARLLFEPGAEWAYTNTAYFALAEIIRAVSGEPWDAFLQKRLFQTLARTSTRTTTMEMVPHRASGYALMNGRMSNA